MEVTATTTTATTVPTAAPVTPAISSDFDTFLKMLTVQIQNQDPLDPMDSSDFAVQLATFSGVEQQVMTNDLLTALSAQMATSDMAQMAAWVGNEARAPAAALFDGSPITVAPNPALVADSAELVVRDAAGAEVQRMAIPVSAEPIEWAGVGPGGTPFPAGLYTFEVISSTGGKVILTDQADIYSTVQEVRAEGGVIMLILEGGVAIPASQVSALRDPSYS